MEDKKSFLLYVDLIHTIQKLPDDKAGLLFKHILKYVNDEHPVTDDLIVEIAFEPIRQQLKRDLVHWGEIKTIRSELGKMGGIKSGEARRSKRKKQEANEPIASLGSEIEANEAVNVTVNDTVTVSDIIDNHNDTTIVVSDEVEDPKKIRADFLSFLRKSVGLDKFRDENEWTEAGRMVALINKIGKEDFFIRMEGVLKDSFKVKNCNRLSYLRKEIESFIHSPVVEAISNQKSSGVAQA